MLSRTDLRALLARLAPWLAPAMVVATVATIGHAVLMTAFEFHLLPGRLLNDFNAFHLVGEMVWRGDLLLAYHDESFFAAQEEAFGMKAAFLWGYPPPYDLVVAALGLLPVWLAYGLFMSATVAAYLVVLRALAGERFALTLLAVLPALVDSVGTGQNGFLTGALIGWFLLAFRDGRGVAGLPLGLMVVKPHLGLAVGVLALAAGRWRVLALGALVAAALSAAATLAFGPAVWPAFLQGAATMGDHLEIGKLRLSWMTSLYAALLSFGAPFEVAMALHVAFALAVLALVVLAVRRGWRMHRVLGLCAFASAVASPYGYGYDLPILGLAVALLMDDVVRLATRQEQVLLLALTWLVCAYAPFASLYDPGIGGQRPPAVAGFLLPLILLAVARLLWRAEARPRAATPAVAA